MKIIDKSKILFNRISYPVIGLISILCLIPFIVIISSSFTSEKHIVSYGYTFLPSDFSTKAYSMLFENSKELFMAYGITIYSTIVGSIISLFVITMTAFVLSIKKFTWAGKFSFFFYFTTLFSGGLVPWYILCVRYLHFKDMPLVALVVPSLFSVFYLIIMRTFLKNTIPEAVIESAIIDGAGYFRIFINLVLPLAMPALATIGLFVALGYWNDWFMSYIFIKEYQFYSLQYYLYRMIAIQDALQRLSASSNVQIADMPKESMKMAMTVIATGPILLLYPFVQRYFIKGLTIGAVKG